MLGAFPVDEHRVRQQRHRLLRVLRDLGHRPDQVHARPHRRQPRPQPDGAIAAHARRASEPSAARRRSPARRRRRRGRDLGPRAQRRHRRLDVLAAHRRARCSRSSPLLAGAARGSDAVGASDPRVSSCDRAGRRRRHSSYPGPTPSTPTACRFVALVAYGVLARPVRRVGAARACSTLGERRRAVARPGRHRPATARSRSSRRSRPTPRASTSGTRTDSLALLETRGLSVRFGGHLAVTDVDLDVEAGAVTGLIGPNGAGKTTTFNLICGVLSPTGGRRALRRPATSASLGTHQRARRGIGRTFQRLEVFGSMTARENVLVGCRDPPGLGRVARRRPAAPRRRGRPVAARRGRPAHGPPRPRPTVADVRAGAAAHRAGPARRARPGARHPAARSCCSTSRRPASTTPRPRSSATCCVELAGAGLADPAGRARRAARDAGVPARVRARLRRR